MKDKKPVTADIYKFKKGQVEHARITAQPPASKPVAKPASKNPCSKK